MQKRQKLSFHLLPSLIYLLVSRPKPRPRQKFISFQMFLFVAFASRRHLLPPLPLLPLRCNSQKQRSLVSFHLLPSLLSWPKPRPRQKFISFQLFLFVAFASRRRPRGL